jgi:hypothetical protein
MVVERDHTSYSFASSETCAPAGGARGGARGETLVVVSQDIHRIDSGGSTDGEVWAGRGGSSHATAYYQTKRNLFRKACDDLSIQCAPHAVWERSVRRNPAAGGRTPSRDTPLG